MSKNVIIINLLSSTSIRLEHSLDPSIHFYELPILPIHIIDNCINYSVIKYIIFAIKNVWYLLLINFVFDHMH